MANLIEYIFNVLLCPELADIIVFNISKLDCTMLHFVNKKLRDITMDKIYRKNVIINKSAKSGYLNIFHEQFAKNLVWRLNKPHN